MSRAQPGAGLDRPASSMLERRHDRVDFVSPVDPRPGSDQPSKPLSGEGKMVNGADGDLERLHTTIVEALAEADRLTLDVVGIALDQARLAIERVLPSRADRARGG